MRRPAATLGAFVAVVALGALGTHIVLGHRLGLSERALAAIFVAVAVLGAAFVLAGAARGEGGSAAGLAEEGPDLDELAKEAELYASSSLPAAVEAVMHGTALAQAAPRLGFKAGEREAGPLAMLARSLEAVGGTAIELAKSHAGLRASFSEAFVNLGRRNQNLVERQLEYISELEQDEADPAVLDDLFRLDHLATRMRRNAESLLVIAGVGPARQLDAPVPAMDLARAACSEVEDYKRVRLHHFDPALVSGPASADLVHVLAELVENALSFSPPGSPVDVYGKFLERGYVIVIVDSGIGMPAEDLAAANQRLRGDDASSELAGRYLGHFVAGKLAARHGLAVSLQPGHSGGLVARVKIPASLIQDAPADLPTLPGTEVPSAPSPSPAPTPPPSGPVLDLAPVLRATAPAQGLAPLPARRPAGAAQAVAPAPTKLVAPAAPSGAAPVAEAAANTAVTYPAREARNTADALRRLTRRVPGTALSGDDGALRRETPPGYTLDAGGAAAALSQYLSAVGRASEDGSR